MKKIVCMMSASALALALSAADTWYWTAKDYTPARPGYADTDANSIKVYGIDASSANNWTNLVKNCTGVPQNGDTIVYNVNYVDTSNGYYSYAGFYKLQSLKLAEIRCERASFSIRQSNMNIMDGGLVNFIATSGGNNNWAGGLRLWGTVTNYVASGKILTIEKSIEDCTASETATLVKTGDGELRVCVDGGVGDTRKYLAKTTSLVGGTLSINIGLCWPLPSGAELRFDSNDSSARYNFGSVTNKYNDPDTYGVVIPDGALVESDDVKNTDHGITSPTGLKLWFTGTPKVSDMVFTGTLYDQAGMVWMPDDSSYMFTFKKATHETTGEIAVSNGTVRVSDRAGFPNLSLVTIRGANSCFRMDALASHNMKSATLAISEGGKVSVTADRCLWVSAVTVDGDSVSEGMHTSESWIDGGGSVYVGGISEADKTDATWTGAVDALSGTAGNWDGSAPDLTGGGAYVTVSGGSGFTASSDIWVNGFDFGDSSSAFSFGATDGSDFWLGSGGVSGGAGTYSLDSTMTLTSDQQWNFKTGAEVDFNKPLAFLGTEDLFINGTTAVYNVNSSLGPIGTQVHFEHKSQLNIAGGVTNNADIRIWNDQTDPEANDYYWSNATYEKPVVFLAGGPTVMNGFFHYTNTSHTIEFMENADVTFNGGFLGRNTTTFQVGSGARVRFNEPLINRNGFYGKFADSTAVFEMNAEANCFGSENPWSGKFYNGTIKLLVPYAMKDWMVPAGTFEYKGDPRGELSGGRFEIAGNATVDFCGNDQSLCCLYACGGTFASDADAVLTLNANDNWTRVVGVTSRVDNVKWVGGIGLVYNGKEAGWPRFMLCSASTTTGRLEVVQGRLVFPAKDATSVTLSYGNETEATYSFTARTTGWPNCSEVTVRGGTLEIGHSNVLGKQTVVNFVKTDDKYGTISLGSGVRQRVRSLNVDGTKQRLGTYGATGSGAKHICDDLFSGEGVLEVFGDGLGCILIVR